MHVKIEACKLNFSAALRFQIWTPIDKTPESTRGIPLMYSSYSALQRQRGGYRSIRQPESMRHPQWTAVAPWTPAAKIHKLRLPKVAILCKIQVATPPRKRYVYTLPVKICKGSSYFHSVVSCLQASMYLKLPEYNDSLVATNNKMNFKLRLGTLVC